MRNEDATNKNHPAGVGDKSPKILVRCIGHEFYYPISDILRLFTGEIPRTEENCVVCDSGAMASVIGSRHIRKSVPRKLIRSGSLSIKKTCFFLLTVK